MNFIDIVVGSTASGERDAPHNNLIDIIVGPTASGERDAPLNNLIDIIVGPTASGKTGFSLDLAKKYQTNGYEAIIINADSRQVYVDFPIISAAPSLEEQAICPHYLFTYLNCSEKINAATWANTANQLIEQNPNKKIILVGGTGLYIKVLLEGIADIPDIPTELQDKIISEWQKNPIKIYSELEQVDPDYAKIIHYNDKQRIARALAVYYHTNIKFSEYHKSTTPIYTGKFNWHYIYKPLVELTEIIKIRTQKMLEFGALEEAKSAYAKYPDTTLPGWTSIGCKELALYLENKISLEECIALWNKNTRAYAKRQLTWFKQRGTLHPN